MLTDECYCPDINFSRLTKNFIILGLILCDGLNDKVVSNQVFQLLQMSLQRCRILRMNIVHLLLFKNQSGDTRPSKNISQGCSQHDNSDI